MKVTIFPTKQRFKVYMKDIDKIYHSIKNEKISFKCQFKRKISEDVKRYDEKEINLKEFIAALRNNNYNIFKNMNYKMYSYGKWSKPILDNKNDFLKYFLSLNKKEQFYLMKASLPSIAFSVALYGDMLNKFGNIDITMNNIKQLSGYISLDFDHLDQNNIEYIKNILFNTFYFIKMIFVSPSGLGLKIICEYTDENNYLLNSKLAEKKIIWNSLNKQLSDIIRDETGLNIDENAEDINRLCFMSYDENVLFREETEPFELKYFEVEGKKIENLEFLNKIITERKEKRNINKENFPVNVQSEIEYIMNFIKTLKKLNKRPFVDHGYNDILIVGFGITDLFKRQQSDYNTAYNLFYNILSIDPYYSNYRGRGEDYIREKFDVIWTSEERDDGIKYASLKYFMNKKIIE